MYKTQMPKSYQRITWNHCFTGFYLKLSYCLAAKNSVFLPNLYSFGGDFWGNVSDIYHSFTSPKEWNCWIPHQSFTLVAVGWVQECIFLMFQVDVDAVISELIVWKLLLLGVPINSTTHFVLCLLHCPASWL